MDWAYPLNEWMPELGLNPPFWFSEEYFRVAGWEIQYNGEYAQIKEEELDIFPMFCSTGVYVHEKPHIWCGIGDCPAGYSRLFLDYEYMYDPKQFLNLSGGKWSLFRKKIKKFYAEYPNTQYTQEIEFSDILSVFENWINDKGEKGIEEGDIEEGDIIIQYLLHASKHQVKGLYHGNKLIGFNMWDQNWKYINFRYSFSDPAFAGGNYALRHLFYTDPLILSRGCLVNDGGSLNNSSLEFFKDHLNPVQKNKLYSWVKLTK